MILVELREERGPHIEQRACDALEDFGLLVLLANRFGGAVTDIKEVVG